MKYRLRMLHNQFCQMKDLLFDATREQCCFLVCGSAQGSDEGLLLVRSVLPLSSTELQIHARDQLSVLPAAMLRVARQAQRFGGSVCMVHTHPMSDGSVGFSKADDLGNLRTFEFFTRLLPNQPNSCLVWDRSIQCVAGRVYFTPEQWEPVASVDIVSGEGRSRHSSERPLTQAPELQFDRQARLLGSEGQRLLEGLRIGIVGCGGIGSVASTLLVHSGLRDFTLVDPDHVERSNLPRLMGSMPEDVSQKTGKGFLIERYIHAHAPRAKIQIFCLPVETPELLRRLISLDVVICSTDDTTSRAFLNQLCHQYLVPVLDLGVQFAADPETGRLVKEVGRVNLMVPGSPCLSCSGHVDPKRLEEEGLSAGDRDQQRKEGYVAGEEVAEPSMMVFNMQVAARGIQHLISWVTSLRPLNETVFETFRFLGLVGNTGIKEARKKSTPGCPFCSFEAPLLGNGDAQRMLVLPRAMSTVFTQTRCLP